MRSRRSILASLLLVSSSLVIAPGHTAADQEQLCGDIQLIHARGIGDVADDVPFFARVDGELSERLGIEPNGPIGYSTYRLGKDGGYGGFEYPAAGEAMERIMEATLLGSEAYQASRDEGIAELVAYLNHRTAQCDGEVYVLTGNSAGADVTGRALAQLSSGVLDRIAFVALFGDPRFETYNTQVIAFGPCWLPRPVWQRGTSECYSRGWYADDFAPYLPDTILDRAGSWCRDNDLVCTGIPGDGTTLEEHTKYDTDGDVDMAMREAAEHLAALLPEFADDIDISFLQFATGNAGADLAFVFDTTGSMWNEIDDVAAQAADLATLWLGLSTNGRVGLIEFRDHGDSFVSRVDLELTNDGSAFQAAVNALEADEGGDIPEAQLSGLMTTLNELDWQAGATKVAVVITDAPGVDPESVTNFTRAQVSQRALEIDPVAIYGVDVLNSAAVTGFMQPLAADTAGEVFVLQPGQSLSDLLEDLLNSVAMSPVPTLLGPYFADIGDPVHFSAAGSFDPDGDLVSYEWDFDGDGSADQTTTAPVVDYTYPAAFSGFAAVRVVSADGGAALATAPVTVQSGGLASVAPVAPAAASASVTGPGEVTVTWTPTANDHADGYTIRLDGTYVFRYAETGSGNSMTITGLDLDEPQTFSVRATNEYGQSAATATGSVIGSGTGWSPSVRVNDQAGSAILSRPSVALGPDGAGYAVWPDSRGPSYDIYFTRRDPSTGTWSANVKVNNDTGTARQSGADIAVDGSNNAYAVWDDPRNGATNSDIYFSKRSAGTGLWGSDTKVNDDTQTAIQTATSIGVTSAGVATAIWIDNRKNKQNLYSSRLAAGGSTWAANLKITSNQTSSKATPDVWVGGDGTAYAVWTDDRNGNNDIYFSKLTAGGSVWSTNQKVSDDSSTARQELASVAVDASDNVLVVWVDYRAGNFSLGLGEVRASLLPAGSSTWSPSVVVADASSKPQKTDLAIRPDGRAIGVWEDAKPGQFEISSAERDVSTGSWTAPAIASELAGTDTLPSVAYAAGQTLLLYQNGSNIYARRAAN